LGAYVGHFEIYSDGIISHNVCKIPVFSRPAGTAAAAAAAEFEYYTKMRPAERRAVSVIQVQA